MFIIGLTGGIGSGKTEACKIMDSLGAKSIDADSFGHRIYERNTNAWKKIIEEFGETILDEDANIVRSKLANHVFSSKSNLNTLNMICHPEIKKLVRNELNQFRLDGVKIAVVEAAILIEAQWKDIVDEVWSIESKPSIIFKRVKNRDNIDNTAIQSRIDSQIDNKTRSKHSTIVITNNGTIEELRKNLTAIWKRKFITHKES